MMRYWYILRSTYGVEAVLAAVLGDIVALAQKDRDEEHTHGDALVVQNCHAGGWFL